MAGIVVGIEARIVEIGVAVAVTVTASIAVELAITATIILAVASSNNYSNFLLWLENYICH